jgi:predicted chitinase
VINKTEFYSELRKAKVFGKSLTSDQVKGIEGILGAFETHGDGNPKILAYALATAYHETGTRMVPVREGFARTDAGARRAVNNLAKKRGPKSAVAKYAQPTGPYNHVYYGRGYVQLTWLDNYRESSVDAGVDLVKNPDAMLDPEISARVLIRGLMDGRWNGKGKGIAYYLPESGDDDIRNARRTVNITDKWDDIGEYYKEFLNAIQKSGTVSEPVFKSPERPTESVQEEIDAVVAEQEKTSPEKPTEEKSSFWSSLFVFIVDQILKTIRGK